MSTDRQPGRRSTAAEDRDREFVIVDTRVHRRYILRAWDTRAEAEMVLSDLLKYYLPDSEWRSRLQVQPRRRRSSVEPARKGRPPSNGGA